MDLIEALQEAIGAAYVLTGKDAEDHAEDCTGMYHGAPLAYVRPGSTAEVASVVRLAAQAGVPVIPVAGNTGLTGGSLAAGGIKLSLDRMNRIREIRRDAQIAIVEAGVILSHLHDAAEAAGLKFPVTFGARGSCMVGGILSTHAGGSNVVRYGSLRSLCFGIEVVLPSGEIVDLMSELRKDNSGYDLRDLFIGAEGTLGIITGAVLRLVPRPRAYATATVAARSLEDALRLLNTLQEETGGAVEAFEYMPRDYMEDYAKLFPDRRLPFDTVQDINIFLEVGATAPHDAAPDETGAIPVQSRLEQALGKMYEAGEILDAVVAKSDTERQEMWHRREVAYEISIAQKRLVLALDVALPLDKVSVFLGRANKMIAQRDPGSHASCVAHLGDGNVHYTIWPNSPAPEVHDDLTSEVEGIVADLVGSFSAEHGIGLSKRASMARRKDPAALRLMETIKAAIDPQNIMNPGKVLPDRPA